MSKVRRIIRYILWVIYTLFVCLGSFVLTFSAFPTSINEFWKLGIAFSFLLLSGGLYFFVRFIVEKITNRRNEGTTKSRAFEVLFCLIVWLVFLGYVVFQFGYLKTPFPIEMDFASKYLQGTSVLVPDFYCGIDWLYALFLDICFTFATSSDWLCLVSHLVIVLLGSVFFYFGVRNIFGFTTAIFSTFGALFIPFAFCEDWMMSPVIISYILQGFFVFIISYFYKESINNLKLFQKCFLFLFSGVIFAFLLFVDLKTFVLLPISIFAFCFVHRDEQRESTFWNALALLLSWFLGMGITIFAFLLCGFFVYGLSFQSLFVNWYASFDVVNHTMIFEHITQNCYLFFALLFFLQFGIFHFFKEKDGFGKLEIVYSICIFLSIVIVNHMIFDNRSLLWLVFMLVLLASICLGRVFIVLKTNQYDADENNQKVLSADALIVDEESSNSKIKLLENPLPGPKKHVTRKLDYDVKIYRNNFKYDIEVDENDDFDLK